MVTWIGIRGGRWWYWWPVCSVTVNDVCAYFAGLSFGKHHLLSLSPNKTIEGFIGGFLGNILVTYLLTPYLLRRDFWKCAPEHFNYGLFEEYSCETISPIYFDREYKLPFPIMGY